MRVFDLNTADPFNGWIFFKAQILDNISSALHLFFSILIKIASIYIAISVRNDEHFMCKWELQTRMGLNENPGSLQMSSGPI